MLHSCIKGFLRAKKLWVNPPKAERAKPSLSSDYNLLFKNKIGERSLDIHRLRLTPYIEGFIDPKVIQDYGIKRIVVEFLRINHWIEKSFGGG